LGDLGLKLVFEPGRMITANAGILVARTIYGKTTPTKRFTIIDAAMNDLIRPTLYDAFHDVWPVREPAPAVELIEQDLVGPICESGDYLTETRRLAPFAPGDLMAFMSAGAYGAVMASTYNSRPLVPEILVNGRDYAVIRPRQTIDDLIALDRIPPWLD
jgi:diaminopimelate decarboxylase